MTTTRTMVHRHVGPMDIRITTPENGSTTKSWARESDLLSAVYDMVRDSGKFVQVIRCADTGDIVEIELADTSWSADAVQDCMPRHWKLQTITIEVDS
jgi:hypothetical protein